MSVIRVLKKRYGFATNSSSSHSVVFCPKSAFQDRDIGCEGPGTGNFGWSFWTAASPEAKRLYWATQLKHNLAHMIHGRVPDHYYNVIVKSLTGVDLSDKGYGIDHQSVAVLPRQHGSDVLDQKFYEHLLDIMLLDGVVVVGGNDNESTRHEAEDTGTHVGIGIPIDRSMDPPTEATHRYPNAKRRCLVSVYDEERDQWVLFNQYTGEKTRFSFSNFRKEVEQEDSYPSTHIYNREAPSGFPELIDIKITDRCDRGCVWCYQGSSARGKHAEYRNIVKLSSMLRDLGVLEVAIGGGEPTAHPEFTMILEAFRRNDIVPNFSTGTLAWLDNAKVVESVRQTVGGFAYTVRSVNDVEQLLNKVIELNKQLPEHKRAFRLKSENFCDFTSNPDCPLVTIHIVMGTLTREEFKAILEKCAAYELGVVLLDYKSRGRGKGRKPIPYDWWIDEVKNLMSKGCYGTVSIDTPMARRYSQKLKDEHVSSMHYDVFEGTRSMYIDMVAGKIAANSYVPASELQSLKYVKGPNLERLYAKFRRDDDYLLRDSVHRQINERERHFHSQGVKFLLRRFKAFRDKSMASMRREDY